VTIGIAAVHRVIPRIGITVGVDAREFRVPCARGQEAGQQGVEVAGVEVLQARLGVVALVDVAIGMIANIGATNRGGLLIFLL
jgi:hypothetical protein